MKSNRNLFQYNKRLPIQPLSACRNRAINPNPNKPRKAIPFPKNDLLLEGTSFGFQSKLNNTVMHKHNHCYTWTFITANK